MTKDRDLFNASAGHMQMLCDRITQELNLFEDFSRDKSKMPQGVINANVMTVLAAIIGNIICQVKDRHHQKKAQNFFNDSINAFIKNHRKIAK